MSNLSCGTHVAEPSANKDCRKLLNQFCRFLPKLKLPISADAKLPLTLTDESKFALSTDGLIPLNTVFFMVGKHIKYLLAVINSSLIHWYFQHTLGSTSGVGTNRWLKYTVECIPVPLIQDDAEWESLVDDIQKYKRDSKDSAVLENIIDNKVFDLYGLSED